ncbi:MAG: hypothetical protein JNK12_14050 [Acidimicrobiales bacterium]|nr:hypothetical protein [Acidimicrobiales bacterium]
MVRPRRQGPKKKEVMIRLEPSRYRLLKAASSVSGTSIQALVEPLIDNWLNERWEGSEAIAKFYEAQRLVGEDAAADD